MFDSMICFSLAQELLLPKGVGPQWDPKLDDSHQIFHSPQWSQPNPAHLGEDIWAALERSFISQGRKELLTPPLTHHLRGHSASFRMEIPEFCLRASLRWLTHLRVLLRLTFLWPPPFLPHKGGVYSVAHLKMTWFPLTKGGLGDKLSFRVGEFRIVASCRTCEHQSRSTEPTESFNNVFRICMCMCQYVSWVMTTRNNKIVRFHGSRWLPEPPIEPIADLNCKTYVKHFKHCWLSMAQSYAQTSTRISTSPKAAAAVGFFYPASTESWLRFDEVPWFTQAKRDRETRSDCVDVACIVVILMKEIRSFNLFWWTPCPPNKKHSNNKHIPADKAVLATDK